MIDLPPDATLLSRQHAHMMAELVRACPRELGQEIYLYCSVAKGYADKYSDIEVTFLVDVVQEPPVYEAWLRSVGAVVDPVTMAWGGGYTTKSWVDGLFIEAAWRPPTALTEVVEKVAQADTTDHWDLVTVWHLVYAWPLTDAPHLKAWQDTLRPYPEALQEKLIRDAIRFLAEPHWYPLSLVNAFKLAERGAVMDLSGELSWTIYRALRILFAVNRQWEPDFKWLRHEAKRLKVKPDRLVERVTDVFLLQDLSERVITCFQLLVDILHFVPNSIDVSKEIAHVSVAMKPDELLRTI